MRMNTAYEQVLHANAASSLPLSAPVISFCCTTPSRLGWRLSCEIVGPRGLALPRRHRRLESDNRVGWEFLRRYLHRRSRLRTCSAAELCAAVDAGGPRPRDPPSIDPFSPKNSELTPEETEAILTSVGLLAGTCRGADYPRSDGSRRRVEHGVDIVRAGPPPDPSVPLVVQVSRWTSLKDMTGVLVGFADFVVRDHGAQLVLAGPVVSAVADDPEGAAVLQECWEAWRHLPNHARTRWLWPASP